MIARRFEAESFEAKRTVREAERVRETIGPRERGADDSPSNVVESTTER
jgi:hypothetical protein